jgi:hypothetical protein
MSPDCEYIQEELLHYLEGETQYESVSIDIETHLESCAGCRERARTIKTLNRMLRALPRRKFSLDENGEGAAASFLLSLPRKSPSANLGRKILETLRDERQGVFSQDKRGSIIKLVRSIAAAAAIAAVLSYLGYQAIGSRDDFHRNREIQVTLGKSLFHHALKSERETWGEER